MIAHLLCWLWVNFFIESWSNFTHYVSYFTNMHSGSFGILPVNKSDTVCLAHLLSSFGLHLVIAQWFKQTLCVSYFTNMYSGSFSILPMNKSDNIWYLIYCVYYVCIFSLNSDIIIHILLSISLRFLRVVSQFDQWIKQTLCVS